MQRKLDAYLWDILEAIDEIIEFTEDLDFDAYLKNRMVRKAVERNFEIIGESLKICESKFPGSTRTLPDVSGFAGFRDRLIHAYFKTNHEIVWEARSNEIQPLREAVRNLLGKDIPPRGEDPFSDE